MHPHVSGTKRVGFLKQDARGNLVVASLPMNFTFSAFLPKVSALNVHWTEHDSYLFFSQKSSDWHFLALAKLRSTAWVWNHQGYPNSWIGWLSLVIWQLPRALLLGDSAGLPCYECFAAGSSTYPCHIWHLLLVRWQLSCALLQGNSADLLHYECYAAGFSLCVK